MPKVSIVLPTYNGEKYIEDAIEGIFCQSMTDWELIIVNDCSTDGTKSIVERLCALDSRIVVIHNDLNRKLPESLNIGFRNARGKYLTWTSDDNIYLRDALSDMTSYLEQHPDYQMVCTGMLMVDDEKHVLNEFIGFDEKNMHMGNVVGASFMYRADTISLVGEYAKDMFCVEDYEYWIRILEKKLRIGYIKGCHYLYRVHNESLTATQQDLIGKQTIKAKYRHFEWIMSGIKNNTEKILHLYHQMLQEKEMSVKYVQSLFIPYLNELEYDNEIPPDKKLILYGAGKIGMEVLEALDGYEIIFVDSNKNSIGNYKRGIPVVSPDQAFGDEFNNRSQHVVISVGFDKQMEIIKDLVERGVKNFSLMGHVVRHSKKGV